MCRGTQRTGSRDRWLVKHGRGTNARGSSYPKVPSQPYRPAAAAESHKLESMAGNGAVVLIEAKLTAVMMSYTSIEPRNPDKSNARGPAARRGRLFLMLIHSSGTRWRIASTGSIFRVKTSACKILVSNSSDTVSWHLAMCCELRLHL
jgi:hypothetical protein